jgi:hypothetical protein
MRRPGAYSEKPHRLHGILVPVVSDRLDWATLHGFFAKRFLFRSFRLLVNVRMSPVIVALEVRGSRFTAEVTVDTLVVYIETTRDILRVTVCYVSHDISDKKIDL